MEREKPLIMFDPDQSGALIRFDIPQPSYFNGINIIELKVPDKDWSDEVKEIFETSAATTSSATGRQPVTAVLKENLLRDSLEIAEKTTDAERIVEKLSPDHEIIVSDEVASLVGNVKEVEGVKKTEAINLERIKNATNVYLKLTRSLTGEYFVTTNPGKTIITQKTQKPRIALIEKYRLENYLGNYGMGRIVSSFYVHPRSRVRLSHRTWSHTESSYDSASSIFDSITHSASSRFTSSFYSEMSKSAYSKTNLTYYSESASEAGFFGFFGAESRSGKRKNSTSCRSEFAKIVSNAVYQHASSCSATREKYNRVNVHYGEENTTTESQERLIENLNAGHVINFLVRELVQEYHSILVLKDVHLVFQLGWLYDEVPLYQLDEFIRKYLSNDDANVKKYREYILGEIAYIIDYNGKPKSIFQIRDNDTDKPIHEDIMKAISLYNPDQHYIDILSEMNLTGKKHGDPQKGMDIKVEGIPLKVNTVSLKTEGMICSALLDPGEGLDELAKLKYKAEGLKDLGPAEVLESQADRNELALKLITEGTDQAIERYKEIFNTSQPIPTNGN